MENIIYRNGGDDKMEEVLIKLVEKLKDCEELLIYGAGGAGKRIYNLMAQSNVAGIVKAFIVKDTTDNAKTVGDITVENYKKFIHSNEKILIALVDDNKTEEVYLQLVKEGVNQGRFIMLNSFEKIALMKRVRPYFNSGEYWQERYAGGGNSGAGSYNRLAEFKADIINKFVKDNNVKTIVEWGCGDGNQLKMAQYPMYIGLDVAQQAIKMCQESFQNDKSKLFIWCGDKNFKNDYKGDLVLSLDVIYHLIEEDVYEQYMQRLFASSEKYVCIYSCNFNQRIALHVKCRKFTDWIEKNVSRNWELLKVIRNKYPYSDHDPDNTSWSDFYFFVKR